MINEVEVLDLNIEKYNLIEAECLSLFSHINEIGVKEHQMMLWMKEHAKDEFGRCARCRIYKPEVGFNKYFMDLCRVCWNFICDLPIEKQEILYK